MASNFSNRKYYDLTLRSGMGALLTREELRHVIAAKAGDQAQNAKTAFLRNIVWEYICKQKATGAYLPRPCSWEVKSGVAEDIRRSRHRYLSLWRPTSLSVVLYYFTYLHECALEHDIETVLDVAMEA